MLFLFFLFDMEAMGCEKKKEKGENERLSHTMTDTWFFSFLFLREKSLRASAIESLASQLGFFPSLRVFLFFCEASKASYPLLRDYDSLHLFF